MSSSTHGPRQAGAVDCSELSLVEFCQLVDFLLDIVSLVRLFDSHDYFICYFWVLFITTPIVYSILVSSLWSFLTQSSSQITFSIFYFYSFSFSIILPFCTWCLLLCSSIILTHTFFICLNKSHMFSIWPFHFHSFNVISRSSLVGVCMPLCATPTQVQRSLCLFPLLKCFAKIVFPI